MSQHHQFEIRSNGVLTLQGPHSRVLTIDTANPRAVYEQVVGMPAAEVGNLCILLEQLQQQIRETLPPDVQQQVGRLQKQVISVAQEKNIAKGSVSHVGRDVTFGDTITIGNITYQIVLPERDGVVRELTRYIPRLNPGDVVGRQPELAFLHQHLFSNRKVLIVNGLGGIGKTTLAQLYLNQYYSDYDHVAWLTQTSENVQSAFITDDSLIRSLGIDAAGMDQDKLFNAILYHLKRIAGAKPGLLVIDNTNASLKEFKNHMPGYPHWHVLATSREVIDSFEVVQLDFLTPDQALALFTKHCPRIKDKEAIAALLGDAHPYH